MTPTQVLASEAGAMKTKARWLSVLALWTGSAMAVLGCGDDSGSSGTGGGGGGTTSSNVTESTTDGPSSSETSSASSSDGGGSGTGTSTSTSTSTGTSTGGTGGGEAEMEVVTAFDAAAFQVPEGLALRGGDAIVGFALTGAIDAVSLADGSRQSFASLPPPPPNTSFMTGVGFAPDGDLVAALVSFTPDAAPGLYRVGPDGGAATLWASHPDVIFPNGLAWDDAGLLYFTDSVAGGVFTADDDGVVSPWATDAALGGDPTLCGGTEDDIAVGANGIVWTPGAVYVAGSDHGVIVRFPIGSGGEAGEAEIVAGPDCDALAGIDGLTVDADGTLVGAVNRADRIVRIDPGSGEVTTLAAGAPLDFPASLTFEDDGSLIVTSFALDGILTGTQADPALVRVVLAD